MKIIIYELLCMIKDGEAPKKIRYSSYVFKYTGDKRISRMYVMENQETYLFRDMVTTLTSEVEILDYGIEKIDMFDYFTGYWHKELPKDFLEHIETNFSILNNKINEIIDRFNNLEV